MVAAVTPARGCEGLWGVVEATEPIRASTQTAECGSASCPNMLAQ